MDDDIIDFKHVKHDLALQTRRMENLNIELTPKNMKKYANKG